MAASGAMADFARMPTSRKILLFVVIGLLSGFLYYRLVFKGLNESLEKAKNQHKQAVGQNKTLDDDLKAFNELRSRKTKLDEDIKQLQTALPNEAEVPAFFETLERKITESGVEVLKWTKQPEANIETFVKVPLEVELTGTFLQIKRFFASLVEKKKKPPAPDDDKSVEERERIVSIEDLVLSLPTIRNREIQLTARFTAVTFRQADAPPPAPGSAGAPAPSSGSTAPPPALPSSGTSAPPLPSSGTPAGAKARTEDALDKDEKRRDGAIEKAGGGDGSARLKGGL